MFYSIAIALVLLVAAGKGAVLVLRMWRQARDLLPKEIPRTTATPLSMGSRLEIAQTLKKRGSDLNDLRVLIDGRHDQQLLDLYWESVAPATSDIDAAAQSDR